MMQFLVRAFVFLLQTAPVCAGVDLTFAAAPAPDRFDVSTSPESGEVTRAARVRRFERARRDWAGRGRLRRR